METILTPNRRLAQHLQGKALSDWLAERWQETKLDRTLLNAFQERIAWTKVIGEHDQLIPLAQEAWRLIHDWQISLNIAAFDVSEETRFFREIALKFKSLLAKQGWITASELSAVMPAQAGIQIVFYGFTDISLALRSLIARCNGKILELPNLKPLSVTRSEYVSPEVEWRVAAQWALKEEGQIGIIIPTLHQNRQAVERVFSEVFSPRPLAFDAWGEGGFNMSLGLPFADYPLIEMALLLLQLPHKLHTSSLTLTELNKILRSPFIGEAEQEFCERAIFEEKLHASHQRHISWELWHKTEEQKKDLCPYLFRRLDESCSWHDRSKEMFLPSVWAKQFPELLQVMGWPGERALSPAEHQQSSRWKELLEEFARLDVPLGNVSFSEAMSLLTGLARRTIFQEKEHISANVQVLGLLEATGLTFDRLWVTGFSDEEWPPAPRPHPFIPFAIQKERQMPHATPDRELQYSEALIQQWCASASHIVFSSAQQVEGRSCGPSLLIKDFPIVQDLLSGVSRNQIIFESKVLEDWQEETPPLGGWGASIKGGTAILRDQAACPFKAFATYRLRAQGPQQPESGLTRAERGSVIHAVLHGLWRGLKSHAALQAFSEQQLDILLEQEVSKVLKMESKIGERYVEIEKACLHSLLKEWMLIERKRSPFEVVSTEQTQQLKLGQLELTVRSDRIDKLEDGRYLIIDYKTGINSIMDWFGERPNEPQLPLYSVSSEMPVGGIAFVALKPDELKFKGISDRDVKIPGIKSFENWDGLVNQWKEALQNLANEFEQGVATITPKDATTCQRCSLDSLCRVKEMTG